MELPQSLRGLNLHKIPDQSSLLLKELEKGDLVWLQKQKYLKLWDGNKLVPLALKTRHDR